jgi:hypothetical protein
MDRDINNQRKKKVVSTTSLLQLQETLHKAQENTILMKEKIFAFENRLSSLDQAMRPVKNVWTISFVLLIQ